MPFRLSHLKQLGESISVPLSVDEDGFFGRECPVAECEGYFKVKPGTGLTGPDLPTHCPYCGHAGPPTEFYTKAQIEYAKSVAFRAISDAFRKDLKQLEFDYKPRGAFGIGISMKLKPGVLPPLRFYREEALETRLTCAQCALEYAVYGLFGFCPDCAEHNSLQILLKNLDLTRRQVALAVSLADADMRRHLLEDALENCVSSFDGFGRECCRVRAGHSSKPDSAKSVSFQNLERADETVRALFGVGFKAAVATEVWDASHVGFMKRHVVSHRSGVVDQRYLDETDDRVSVLGRRLEVLPEDISRLCSDVETLGKVLLSVLPPAR